MNHTIPFLQIRVHKLDGTASTFVQDDLSQTKQLLDEFQPAEIFNRQRLALGDCNSLTSIPSAQITRIDLDSEEHSHLIFPSGLVEAVELTKNEFEMLLHNVTHDDQWKHLGELDAVVVAFLNIEMADGQCVLLTMEVDAESPQGLGELRDYLLGRPVLCFRMRSGGVGVLNLANLVQLTFFPGMLQPSPDAWHVRLVEASEPAEISDDILPETASGSASFAMAGPNKQAERQPTKLKIHRN
jgi:hypothetical protein